MIQQAKSYLRGATWATALVGICLVAFALLVAAISSGGSPLSALGLGDTGAVVVAEPGSDSVADRPVAAAGPQQSGQAQSRQTPDATGPGRPGAGARQGESGRDSGAGPAPQAPDREIGTSPPAAVPVERPSRPSRPTPPSSVDRSPASQTPPTGTGNRPATRSSGSANGSRGSQAGAEAPASGGGATGTGTGGTGGESGSGSTPTLNEGLDSAVEQVDQATGGALEQTGLDQVVKEVNDGLLGPETTVGKTVDGVTGALGGLLGPRR